MVHKANMITLISNPIAYHSIRHHDKFTRNNGVDFIFLDVCDIHETIYQKPHLHNFRRWNRRLDPYSSGGDKADSYTMPEYWSKNAWIIIINRRFV